MELDPLDLSDIGVSAFKGKNRSQGALKLFLDKASNGELGPNPVLLIEDLDRFSRQPALQTISALITDVANAGITLVVLRHDYAINKDTLENDPATWWRLIGAVQNAHDSSKKLSDRINSAKDSAVQQMRAGKTVRLGNEPFWINYDAKTDSFVIDEPWAELVRKVFNLACEFDYGFTRIAQTLNAEGSRTKKGQRWAVASIRYLLKNRQVLGEHQPMKTQTVKGKRKQVPNGPPIPDRFPALIDEAKFILVQEKVIARRSKTGPRNRFNNWLQGRIRCSCGGRLTTSQNKIDGQAYDYLRCSNNSSGLRITNCKQLRLLDVTAAVLTNLGEMQWRSFFPDEQADAETAKAQNDVAGAKTRLEEAEAKHRQLKAKVTEAALADGALSLLKILSDAADDAAEDIELKKAELNRAEVALAQATYRPSDDNSLDTLLSHVAGVMDCFSRGADTFEIRRELNDLFVQAGLKVVMDQEKQRVGFSLRDSEVVWRSYDPDLAVLQLRHRQIKPELFPSVMQEHEEVLADIGPKVKGAMEQRRAELLAEGKDPSRTNLSGQVLTDDEIAASTEWLLSKFRRDHTRNIGQEAAEIRREVGRRKFQAAGDS